MNGPQPAPRTDLSALRIERRDELPSDGRGSGRLIARIAAAAVVAIALFFVYQKWIAPSRTPEVETLVVKRTLNLSAPASLTATGYLVADRKAEITPKVSGRVARLFVAVGSQVKSGDPIAYLESDSLKAQLDEARASYVESSREYQRQQKLWAQGVTSRATLDGAQAQAQVARARVDGMEVSMRDSMIRAPFDATVTRKSAEIGEMVSPISMSPAGGASAGGSIVSLADLRTLEVEADVNEANLGQLREGQPAEISVDAFPGRKWRGRLRQIIPTANRAKGVVQVKVAFVDPADRLLPEMSASVSFLQNDRTQAELQETPKVWVPSSAIVSDGGEAHVVIVDSKKTTRLRKVVVGKTHEGRVEIVSGLTEGDKIIIKDPGSYKDNQTVRIAEP